MHSLWLAQRVHGRVMGLAAVLQEAVVRHTATAARDSDGSSSGTSGSLNSSSSRCNWSDCDIQHLHGSKQASLRSLGLFRAQVLAAASPSVILGDPHFRGFCSSSCDSNGGGTISDGSSSSSRGSNNDGCTQRRSGGSRENKASCTSRYDRWSPLPPAALSSKQQPRSKEWYQGQQYSHTQQRYSRQGSSSKRNDSDQEARLLTGRLTATRNLEQLLLLVQQSAADMNHINLSAAYTHAKRLCRSGMTQQQPGAVQQQQLLQHLHQCAEQLQQQCEARQLANIIWSCAYVNRADTVQLLLPHFLQDSKLQQANPQAVANVLWACADLSLQLAESDVQQLVQRFMQLLPQANPQNVSNTLWACATLKGQLAENEVQLLIQKFVWLLPQANPQNVSNTLWACATLGLQPVGRDVQQLVQSFVQVLPQAKPQEVSNTLLACGRLQYDPEQLLSALDQQATPLNNLLSAAKPQALANMAWACGQLGCRGKLPGMLLQQAVQLLRDSNAGRCSMQDLCNLCWSAAVLDLQQCVPQVLQLAQAAVRKHMWAAAVNADLQQFHQVHLWLHDCQLQDLSGVLSPQQLQQCKDSWEQLLQVSTSSANASDLHMSVFAAVKALPAGTWQQPQGAPELEQRTTDGAHSIDIAATTNPGVQLAIEVDGPYHFVRPRRKPTGSTLFRNRALAARGYVLVSIPYWEWDILRGAEQKQQYLLSKLQDTLQAPAAAVKAISPSTA